MLAPDAGVGTPDPPGLRLARPVALPAGRGVRTGARPRRRSFADGSGPEPGGADADRTRLFGDNAPAGRRARRRDLAHGRVAWHLPRHWGPPSQQEIRAALVARLGRFAADRARALQHPRRWRTAREIAGPNRRTGRR